MDTAITKRRFTVDEYHRMVDAGILTEDDRVELIRGEIVDMPPIGRRHAAAVRRITDLLYRCLGQDVQVSVQSPITLSPDSEPEPDLAVVRARSDHYESGHPGPGDVLLLIEVADSSLPFDRDVKLPLYGGHGIPEVWLVDLRTDRVEVHRDPFEAGYRERRLRTATDVLEALVRPEIRLSLRDVFLQRGEAPE